MKVSIGIPFFNNEGTLTQAVRSVFAQSFTDWELILMDDGSTDSCLAMAMSIRDPRVSVVSDGERRGLPARLNAITQMAKGDYIARMDADDIMHPDRLAEQVRFLERHPEYDLVATGMTSIDRYRHPYSRRSLHQIRATGPEFLRGRTLAHVTVMARRDWMLRNRYDEQFRRSQDYELWCRAVRNSDARFANIQTPLLFCTEEGAVRFRKLMMNSHYHALAAWRHGPAVAGWPTTLQVLAKTYGKAAAYLLVASLKLECWLVRRRGQMLSSEEIGIATLELQRALAADVPGWEMLDDQAVSWKSAA